MDYRITFKQHPPSLRGGDTAIADWIALVLFDDGSGFPPQAGTTRVFSETEILGAIERIRAAVPDWSARIDHYFPSAAEFIAEIKGYPETYSLPGKPGRPRLEDDPSAQAEAEEIRRMIVDEPGITVERIAERMRMTEKQVRDRRKLHRP